MVRWTILKLSQGNYWSTHFDFFGALEYRFGELLDVFLVFVVDRLADLVLEERLGVGGVLLDFFFQLVDFIGYLGVGAFAHDVLQFADFGFQLQAGKKRKKNKTFVIVAEYRPRNCTVHVSVLLTSATPLVTKPLTLS